MSVSPFVWFFDDGALVRERRGEVPAVLNGGTWQAYPVPTSLMTPIDEATARRLASGVALDAPAGAATATAPEDAFRGD
jgi:hypothetical protein